MKALILIGGLGTRLRPFTCDFPKPLLPVVNKPFLEYQFEVLKRHGIREAVLCTAYKPDMFHKVLGNGRKLGMRLHYVHETKPLGTGGAIKNAQAHVQNTVLVLNGDILHNLDITAFLRFHRHHKAEASIALTRVKDPTLYGLVTTKDSGQIKKFIEKPSWDEIVTNSINAGAYLLEPSVLSRIPAGIPYSVERSLFPHMLEENARLFGYLSSGYWMDIGTLDKYLQVHLDVLSRTVPFSIAEKKLRPGLWTGARVRLGKDMTWDKDHGCIVVGAGSKVGDFTRFARHVCIGERCSIGKGSSLQDCVVLEGTTIEEGAVLKNCIIGPRCLVGKHSVIPAGTALAGKSIIRPYTQL